MRFKFNLTKCLFCLLIIFVALIPISYAKKQKHLWEYKKQHFNQYSLQDDILIGEQFMKAQIDAFHKKNLGVNPPKYENTRKRIQAIIHRLAAVSDIPNLPYEVTIFDKKDVVNAYCLPGGKIGVFTGLFDQKNGLVSEDNDDEIASVLAHEIAHATMRHVTRRLTTYNSLGVLTSLVSMGVSQGVGQNWGYLANQVFSTGTFLYLPSYSRKHEKEADRVGFYYLVKAGFDPQASIQVWDRAAKQAQHKGKAKTNFFDSHPASGERADYLRSFMDDVKVVQERQDIMRKIRK